MGSGALLLALLLPFVPVPQDKPRAHPEVDQDLVDKAIEKGTAFLRAESKRLTPVSHGPYNFEYDELVAWTLIHADVPESDPDLAALLDRIYAAPLERTYQVSLQAMIWEKLDAEKYRTRIEQCAQFLADNLCENGQWSYGETVEVAKLPERAKDVATAGGDPSASPAPDEGEKDGKKNRKTSSKNFIKKRRKGPEEGDNSNSQYAALGMRACHDAGIDFPKELLVLARGWWAGAQNTDGGWGYKKDSSYGTMTWGGIGSICIYDYMMGMTWKKDQKALSGFGWANQYWSVTENLKAGGFTPKMHNYYYLYALERACMLFGTETVGAHKWYVEGAKHLLSKQQASGAWQEHFPIEETCFAILFLRRATKRLDVATGDRRFQKDPKPPSPGDKK